MAASLSGLFNLQIMADDGTPAENYRLYTFAYGTSTFKAAYTEPTGVTAHTYSTDSGGVQYIPLNSRGELPAPLYLATGGYDLTLKTAAGASVWTRRADPVSDAAASLDTALRAALAATSGAALIGYLGTSTSEVATTGSAFLNLVVKGARKSFGCSGAAGTNDYTKIAAAITTTGKIIEFEAGTYLYNTNLPAPTCSGIVGEGSNVSILKPGAGLTRGLSVGATNSPTQIRGIKIDGSLATTATLLFLGEASSAAVKLYDVLCQGASGSGGVGVRYGDLLKSDIVGLTCYGNETGLLVQGVSAGYPTTVKMTSSVLTNSGLYGAKLVSGEALTFDNVDFESSGAEGTLLLPASAGRLIGATFVNGCWWEDNWRGTGRASVANGGTGYAVNDVLTVVGGVSTTAMTLTVSAVSGGVITAASVTTEGVYSEFPAMPFSVTGGGGASATFNLNAHVRIGDGTTIGGARLSAAFRDPKFALSGGTPIALYANGSICDVAVSRPGMVSVAFPAFIADNSARIEYSDFGLSQFNFALVTSDRLNKCTAISEGWRTWTPTITSDLGNAAATFSAGPVVQFARFQRMGLKAQIAVRITGTTVAGTPAYIKLTLPTGFTVAQRAITAGHIIVDSVHQSSTTYFDESASVLYIYKADWSVFPASKTLDLHAIGTVELT